MTENITEALSLQGGSSDAVNFVSSLIYRCSCPFFFSTYNQLYTNYYCLSFARNAMGTQQSPPNQVLLGLALFLSLFIMKPIYQEVNEQALEPMLAGEITREESFERAEEPIKDFMLEQTRTSDLELFVELSNESFPDDPEDLSLFTVIPAFAISELRTAFTIGFLIFVPFLVIDIVVASILMSMGMFMLSPVMISLPFKLLLFVMVDGWYLVVESLVGSFY